MPEAARRRAPDGASERRPNTSIASARGSTATRNTRGPRASAARKGVAYLYFVIDRTGRVLDYRLRQSSGHGSLDRATVDMIRRADPLPRMPDSIAQARLELVVPIEFQPR